MPEVKWVHKSLLRKQRLAADTPVLTLDDLEAWLTQCIEQGYVNIAQCIDDVRAMKER